MVTETVQTVRRKPKEKNTLRNEYGNLHSPQFELARSPFILVEHDMSRHLCNGEKLDCIPSPWGMVINPFSYGYILYIYIYVYVYIYILCIYIYICISMHVCMYIYIYV